MKNRFPIHGVLGIVVLILSEILLFKKVDPVYSWFYCFAWWSYIFIIDAIVFRLKGNSLMVNRTGEFLLMIPWSVFIWSIFEAANLFLKNWYYINLPHSLAERWLGYAVAYGTVLPGLFETAELLESIGLFEKSRIRRTIVSFGGHTVLIFLGIICLAASVLIPEHFFPLIWVGFAFLLDPLNYRFKGRSLLKDLEDGNPRKIYLLLVAGLICGLLWEFWNFWARSKWVYTVPFFEAGKGFEMPYLGFLGFPPFAVQAYVMYNTISLLRSGRGWEESSYRLAPGRRTRPLTATLTAILIISFSILVFRAIDLHTVDSYYPRLKDAYWIEPRYQDELPKVGITTLDDLISKTVDKKERDELALRLLVPREELIRWVEMAQLAQLKGLGIENLRLLEKVGVDSVSTLAGQDPDELYTKLKEAFQGGRIPRKAIIQLWIKGAQKKQKL
jgi:hypothetical protein